MHTTPTPEQAALLQGRPDVRQRLYTDEQGRRHVVSFIERQDRGRDGYERCTVIMWNPEALGRGFVVISPEVFYASTEPVSETVGEGLTA